MGFFNSNPERSDQSNCRSVGRDGVNAQQFNWYATYTDAANYEGGYLTATTAASAITLGARTGGTGADNLDIKLVPAGSGLVSFGTNSASASITGTGYISIKDASGNTVKLMTA